jgi:hypothetical protein
MLTFTVIFVDPAEKSWTDLRDGYRVVGQLIVDEVRDALKDCIPNDPGYSYVDETSGQIYRKVDGTLEIIGNLISYLGYHGVTEAIAMEGATRIHFDLVKDEHLANLAKRVMTAGIEMNEWHVARWLKTGRGLFITRTGLVHMLLKGMIVATGMESGLKVRDLLPNLRTLDPVS